MLTNSPHEVFAKMFPKLISERILVRYSDENISTKEKSLKYLETRKH